MSKPVSLGFLGSASNVLLLGFGVGVVQTVSEADLHWTVPAVTVHYTIPSQQVHYTVSGDLHYTVPDEK